MRSFFPRKKLLLPRPIPICLSPALLDGAFALCVRRVPVASQPCFGLVVLYERPALHVSLVSAFKHLPARCQYHHAQPVVLHHIVYIHSLPLVIYPLHFPALSPRIAVRPAFETTLSIRLISELFDDVLRVSSVVTLDPSIGKDFNVSGALVAYIN